MDSAINLLEDLIKIDSSTKPGIHEAMAYCEQWLKERDIPVKRIDNQGYPMLVSQIGKGDHTIVLNGHIDVVAAEESQYQPYRKEGKLYGRGAADMKAGVAAFMMAINKLKNKDLSSEIMLQIVPDEETGGTYGTKYLADNGYLGDFIICGEPTNLGIGIQAKGVLQLDITVSGKSAHGSRPWEGENAIAKAVGLYDDILELPFAQENTEMYDGPSINLAKIQGGDIYNIVPDRCTMSLDIRYLPEQSPDEIIRQIESITSSEVVIHTISIPVKTEEDNPYVKKLEQSLKRMTQLENPNFFGQHGSNDGVYFLKYGGSVIEFGPVGKDWHGENERVNMDSVLDYQEVLVDFILSISTSESNVG
jgi:succinyl-diaminopimelate desuccinylase